MSNRGGYNQSRDNYQNRGQQGSNYQNRGQQGGNYQNRGQQQQRGGGQQQQRDGGQGQMQIDPSLNQKLLTVKAVDSVKRSWVGTKGEKCKLIANYFNMNIQSNVTAYHYIVDVQVLRKNKTAAVGEGDGDRKETPILNRFTRRHVLWEFLKRNVSPSHKFKFVFDDRTNLYSTVNILKDRNGGDLGECQDTFECDDPNLNETMEFHVTIKKPKDFSEFELEPQQLNLILSQLCRHPFAYKPDGSGVLKIPVYCEIDRRFMESMIPGLEPFGVNKCIELLRGLESSVKRGPGGILLANYDIKHSAFLKQGMSLLEFYALSKRVELPNNWSELKEVSLNPDQRSEMNSFLHGMLVSRSYGNEGLQKRNERFVKVLETSARETKIGSTGQTVEQFFARKYGIRLQLPYLPLVQIGNPKKEIYVPMECLKMADKRQRLRMKLPDDIQARVTGYTTVKPLHRFNIIKKSMEHSLVGNDPVAKEFGIFVDTRMLEIEGRILNQAPIQHRIKDSRQFGDTIAIKLAVVTVNNCIRNQSEVEEKMNELKKECSKYQLNIGNIVYKNLDRRAGNIENWLTSLKNELGQNSLAVFILGDRDTDFYDQLKFLADLKLGLRTQVVKSRTFLKIGNFTMNANLFRKIISKVGGATMKVESRTWNEFSDTLYIGIDVTHPAPGDLAYPSVAAVVSNLDKEATKYGASVMIQRSKCEEVLDMYNMFKDQLEAYKKTNGSYPKRCIVYRDGVSDGQFEMVCKKEVGAMRRFCERNAINIKFTVIIVQKRHSTRFYAPEGRDQNGNVLPGTVVDRYITNEDNKQGTSKPINCYVVEDDSNFSADQIETCTNLLCNVFSRASGPVSLPTPVYYAHLVCFRARAYINYMRRSNQRINDEENLEKFNPHEHVRPYMYFS